MNSKDSSVFFNDLSKVTEKLSSVNSLPDIHLALKELYRTIQKCTLKYDNFTLLTSDHQDIFFSLIHRLTSILTDNAFPADSILLSSTCLAVVSSYLFSAEFASTFLISLYYYIGKEPSGCLSSLSAFTNTSEPTAQQYRNIAQHCISQSHNVLTAIQEFNKEDTKTSNHSPKFQQIALLHGILSCQKSNIFTYTSKIFKQEPFLILMFHQIHQACLTPCSSQYHAFSVLIGWLRTFEKLQVEILEPKSEPVVSFVNNTVIEPNSEAIFLFDNNNKSISEENVPSVDGPNKPKSVYFSSNTEILSKILSLLASNWESPIKGVSGFVKEAYRVVISLSNAECELLKVSDFNVVELLLEQTLKLSWKIKGKYLVLSVVLQFVDCKKFLEENPEVPHEVIWNIKANYASSVTSEVYKTIVSSMIQYSSPDDRHTEWSKWWKIHIIESLCSNDKLLIQNVTNLILPWTLRIIPKSYQIILDDFEDGNIAPQLMLLRIAKESSICFLQEKEIKLIRKYLHHYDIQLRIEIISILCCSPKKSEPMSVDELDLLKDFITVNLNIDSTPFQQQLLSQLRILLVRIRDSLVPEFRSKTKEPGLTICPHQIEFIDWLAKTAVKNTFPGACFQRRRLSLHILNIIFDVFIVSPMGNKRKEKPSKFVEELISVVQSKGSWKFFNDDLLFHTLPCITDFTDEIRLTTYKLIVEFASWPVESDRNGILKLESIFSYAHFLCNHPDYRSNDGGALLVCLIYRNLHIKKTNFTELECTKALMYLSDIILIIMTQLNSLKTDVSSAEPIHGYLLSLQYCMNNSKDVLSSLFKIQKDKTLSFIRTVTDLCDDVIQFMLNVMKGGDEKSNCPSFSDIGQALEKLVVAKQAKPSNPSHENYTAEIETNNTYSPEVELLLSCCWHSIKNSCFLLCELAYCISELDMEAELKKQFLQNIATKLSSILITCRHRGVVDACCLSLNKFCVMLLKNDVLHEEICKFLLNSVFDSLSYATSTSVTRRSAGLPSLIQAVVSSEQNNIKRRLLSFTIEKLLRCIYQPLTPTHPISDKTDLPQAHAYHILKALVTDSSLSQAILSYLNGIIPACVAGFSSTLWPIRNGALQLFGVLLPRICGQKKVREDNSEHNLVSAPELFARCPSLKTYLIQQLKKCVTYHQSKKLCSELVPVLSVIVKLAPPQDGNDDSVMELKTFLLELLDVPIWNVRDLVSSALSVLMTTNDVMCQIKGLTADLQMNSINCNKIHGNLLVIQKVLKRNNIYPERDVLIASLVELYNVLTDRKCPLLLALILEVILEITNDMDCYQMMNIYSTFNFFGMNQPFDVGQTLHECKVVLITLKSGDDSDIPTLIQQQAMKDVSVLKECLQFLNDKLKSRRLKENFIEEGNLWMWKEVYVALLEYIKQGNHPSIIQETLKFMIDLCNDWRVGFYILDSDISQSVKDIIEPLLEMKSGLSSAALSFTMLSLCIKADLQRQKDSDHLNKWNTLFNSYSQPRSPDVLRMQAACSVACLGPTLVDYIAERIKESPDYCTLLIGLSEGSLLLLQDEDEEIRSKACEFPSKIPHKYEISSLQFNVGIQVIFQCLLKLLQDDSNFLLYLWNRLLNFPSTAKVLHGLRSVASQKKMNLFEQEYVNVYAEPIKILLEYKELLRTMLKNLHTTNNSFWKEQVEMFISDLKIEITDLLNILYCQGYEEFNEGFAYSHQEFLALKKIHCQLEVILEQSELLSDSPDLCKSLCELSCDWKKIEKRLTVITCWFLHHL